MKTTSLWMLLASVIVSCTPLKQASIQETPMPFLAAIGKQQKALLHTDFTQVGAPRFTTTIALSVATVPFTSSSFKAYQVQKAKKGEQPRIVYVDSVPHKPNYVRFEIKDRIGLKALLNTEANASVRSYVAKDSNCKIVSSISLVVDEAQAASFCKAEGLFLTEDANGIISIMVVNGRSSSLEHLPKNELFAYEVAGFCWGENRYGEPEIETLTAKGNCPNGTVKKAEKLEDLQLFSKL